MTTFQTYLGETKYACKPEPTQKAGYLGVQDGPTDRQTAEQGQARGLSFKNCQVRVPFRKTPSENCAWNLGFQPPSSVPSCPRCNLHAHTGRNPCSELCSVMPLIYKNGARRSQVSPRSCLGSGPRGCGPGSGAWRKWGVGSESSRPDFRLLCGSRRFGGVSPRKASQSPPTSASPGLEALLSAGAAQALLEALE